MNVIADWLRALVSIPSSSGLPLQGWPAADLREADMDVSIPSSSGLPLQAQGRSDRRRSDARMGFNPLIVGAAAASLAGAACTGADLRGAFQSPHRRGCRCKAVDARYADPPQAAIMFQSPHRRGCRCKPCSGFVRIGLGLAGVLP